MIRHNVVPHFKTCFSAVHTIVQQAVEFCNDLSRNNIYKEKQLPLIHTYWALHLIIDLSASTVRSHPDDPPRSFNWSDTNLFHAILCHSTSQYLLLFAWHQTGVRADLVSATSFSKASCLQRIHFWRKSAVRHAFYYLFQAVPVTVYFTVKMSRDAIVCCPAIAS